MRTSFKTSVSKKRGAFTKPLGNDKFVYKKMFSSYPMKQKAFKEASCINNIHFRKVHGKTTCEVHTDDIRVHTSNIRIYIQSIYIPGQSIYIRDFND